MRPTPINMHGAAWSNFASQQFELTRTWKPICWTWKAGCSRGICGRKNYPRSCFGDYYLVVETQIKWQNSRAWLRSGPTVGIKASLLTLCFSSPVPPCSWTHTLFQTRCSRQLDAERRWELCVSKIRGIHARVWQGQGWNSGTVLPNWLRSHAGVWVPNTKWIHLQCLISPTRNSEGMLQGEPMPYIHSTVIVISSSLHNPEDEQRPAGNDIALTNRHSIRW